MTSLSVIIGRSWQMLRCWLPLAIALSFSAAGCGDSGGAAATVAQQPTSGPAAAPSGLPTTTTPTTTSGVAGPEIQRTTTPTTTAPVATTGVPPGGGESQPGGAGDEQPARTPAAFIVDAQGIRPQRITVAAFLAVDLSVTAEGAARHVEFQAPGGGPIDVAQGATAHRLLAGLKPGDYPLVSADGGRAILHVVSGGAPGP